MPGRYIREGILTSDKVDALSESAEVFYRRLLNVVDDHGRYYASTMQLFCNCYPMREQKLNEEEQLSFFRKIKLSLVECVNKKLIIVYGEKKYLQLLNFQQNARYKSKFPPSGFTTAKPHVLPPLNGGKTMVLPPLNRRSNDNDNDNVLKKKKIIKKEKPERPVREEELEKKIEECKKNSGEKSLGNWIAEIYRSYPKRAEKIKSEQAIKQAIGTISESTGKTNQDAAKFLLDRVRQFAQSKVGKGPPNFCKNPARWFAEGCYDDDEKLWEIDYNPGLSGSGNTGDKKNGKYKSKNKFDPANYDPLAKGKGGFYKLHRNRTTPGSEPLPGLR